MEVVGLLLTGGRSSRMGQPKALLRLGDGTFLARTIRTLQAGGLDSIAIVTGPHDREIREAVADLEVGPGVWVVHNPQHDRGQLSSIVTGLDAFATHQADAVLVALIDHPMVQVSTVGALVEAFRDSRAPVVRPVFQGRHGHPVLFSCEVFDALRSAPADAGARSVVRAMAARVRDVTVEDPGVVVDIDTPEDYGRALEAFAASRGEPGRGSGPTQ